MNNRVPQRVALLCLLLLQACVYVPRTHVTRDPNCVGLLHHMTLETDGQFNDFHILCNSSNQDACAALLVAGGAVAATSFIISGSIVMAGNVVYWMERKANCKS